MTLLRPHTKALCTYYQQNDLSYCNDSGTDHDNVGWGGGVINDGVIMEMLKPGRDTCDT